MKNSICVVTGSRSEYGLLRWLMQDIKDDPNLALQLIARINNSNPRKLFSLVRTRPIEFDRLIQHTFSIAS